MLSDSEKKTILPMLQGVSLFSSLDKKGMNALANSMTKKTFKSGEVIAKQGDMGTAFYMILEGVVEVRSGKKTLAKLGKGKFFGEMALIDNQPRSADVIATADTVCVLLTSWNFTGVIGSNPEIAQAMMKELVSRLRETDNTLKE
jgi:CRP/FNR family transcriptional regulator, cyclic AMP receptor protein